MKHSTDRILTTHVGSLPRPPAVFELLRRKEDEQPVDAAEFEAVIGAAVRDIVARQRSIGIDVVSDGEMSKASYATYVKDRLSGFGGNSERKAQADLRDYPDLRKRLAAMTGPQAFRRPLCIGEVQRTNAEPLRRDLARFRAALEKTPAVDAFVNAASPGVVTSFLPNRHYPTTDAYIDAVSAAMKQEYEPVVAAGFVLQVDCPDLAMSRHTGFQELSEAEFLRQAEHQVEALNEALANVPASSIRMHICWGNYEGPHDHDIGLEKILSIILKAKPQAISFEASNPRHEHEWAVWAEAKIPEEKILIPGVLDTLTNVVEHPELVAQRLCKFADIVGRERVIAGSDCGFGTAAGHGKLDPEISFKKLSAMVEGAAIASKRLWSAGPRGTLHRA
ncbi:MAG TPA: cobalamin-independent methionine synthase II family protein [Alphaproteobacteria bacterium]|nr:cobalamin-independent methionine synthase II family protein [Alphaproteobacteria bacterium]